MSNQLQLAGAQDIKPVRFAPIWTNRFFSGLWTQRSPLRDAGSTRIEEKFYGARGDAMITGSNVEISTRLTPVRRPGNSVYNSSTFTAVDYFYEFRLFNGNSEQIKVMVDQAGYLYEGTGPTNRNLVWTKSAGAGQTFMQYVANILYFGNGVDTKKWVQTLTTWTANTSYTINPTTGQMTTFIIDPNGNIEQLIAYAITTITNIEIDGSNNLTATVASNAGLTVGDNYVLWDLTTATFLNGETITIATLPSGQFTAKFTHATYASAPDTGAVAQQQGGSPVSGSVQPTWNTSSTAPNNATIDNSCIWVNRGDPVENWGIAAASTAPTVTQNGVSTSWQANAFYSNDGAVIIDSNGNLQQVTTFGTSGSVAPTWATVVGHTTVDGGVTWTMIQTAASLTWTPSTVYTQGTSFVTATISGTACLFQLAPASSITFTSPLTAYFYTQPNDYVGFVNIRNAGGVGLVQEFQGGAWANVSPAAGPITVGSLLFNPATPGVPDPWYHFFGDLPITNSVINGAGILQSTFNPWAGATDNYAMCVFGTFYVPVAGTYTFSISHDDAMLFAISGASSYGPFTEGMSGPPAGYTHTATAYQGYFFAGTSPVAGNNETGFWPNESYSVTFPTAGSYPFEIDFAQLIHAQTLVITCNGFNVTPNTITYPTVSGVTAPIWPVWSTSFAPAYPSVSETTTFVDGTGSAGTIMCPNTWNNLGPVTDFVWHANTLYPASTAIIDPNGNQEAPYRTGVTGITPPLASAWKASPGQLTADNPNLIWVNQGPEPAGPAGTISTYSTQGWIYYVALVNTLTNTVSNCGPASTQTGSFSGATSVLVTGGLPATIDPQADYVAIFRTLDGGATPLLIPGVGNSVYTLTLAEYQANGFTDTTPDANLNLLLQGPIALQNTPPLSGAINLTYYLSRIFFSVGNTVYWTAGPLAPVGNGNEGVPPLNSAIYPSLVTRIVPTSYGCLVFTVSDVYLLSGQATSSSPLYSQPYATGIGLLSYNALAINGTVMYLFTSDSQVISFDPSSGISQVGFPIGDQFQLSNWNPANAYVTWHVSGSQDHALYVSDGQTGWFRMTPTASPETGLNWSPFATIVGGCKAVQSIEVSPGVHKLLVGPFSTGPILKRDYTTWQDNGTSYSSSFTIGSIVLAQPGQIAELAFITTDSTATGTPPTLGVLLGEINGTFDNLTKFTTDPPQLPASSSLYSQRFYFSQTKDPALCRHFQLQVSWPTENAGNELLSLTAFGGFAQET